MHLNANASYLQRHSHMHSSPSPPLTRLAPRNFFLFPKIYFIHWVAHALLLVVPEVHVGNSDDQVIHLWVFAHESYASTCSMHVSVQRCLFATGAVSGKTWLHLHWLIDWLNSFHQLQNHNALKLRFLSWFPHSSFKEVYYTLFLVQQKLKTARYFQLCCVISSK